MTERKGGSAAVERVLAVLDGLATSGAEGIGAQQLSARLGMSRSSVRRLLSQLSASGFVQNGPDGSFEVGPLGLAWAEMLAPLHTLVWAASDVMAELAGRFDETVYLVTYEPGADEVLFVATSPSSQPIRYKIDLPSSAPLHAGAAGKAVLSLLGDEVVDRLELRAFTHGTQRDREALRADLADCRERGYATSWGERIAEACGVAAPVTSGLDVLGALTVTTPMYRADRERIPEIGRAVSEAAYRLSALLTV